MIVFQFFLSKQDSRLICLLLSDSYISFFLYKAEPFAMFSADGYFAVSKELLYSRWFDYAGRAISNESR